MDAVREWAWMLCGAAVFCGGCSFLFPAGNGKQLGKFVAALVFLSCILLPLRDTLTLEFPQLQEEQREQSQELQLRQDELAYSIAESHILKLIQTALEQENLPVETISVAFSEETLRVELCLSSAYKDREKELERIVGQSCGVQDITIKWQEEIWTETGKPSAQR